VTLPCQNHNVEPIEFWKISGHEKTVPLLCLWESGLSAPVAEALSRATIHTSRLRLRFMPITWPNPICIDGHGCVRG
jgi:hypothetical protein